MNRTLSRLLKVVAVALVLGFGVQLFIRRVVFRAHMPEGAAVGARQADVGDAVTVIATDLEVPWEVAFLEDGDFLVTERPGRLLRLSPDGARRWSVDVPGVHARGEGGLMGLALDPHFADNRRIYLHMTAEEDNRVVRFELSDDGTLTEERVLLAGLPAGSFHNGGRIAFGPDGMLYATAGEAGNRSSAQDPLYMGGKIFRMTSDGAVPPDSVRPTRVYSLGHRNPQGLAWDAQGRLWETEHGRSGATTGLDELNLIEPGGNYGWPESQGDEVVPGTIAPVLHSGPDATWAPGGVVAMGDHILFAGLRGEALYDVAVDRSPPAMTVHFFGDFGRIRDVRVGPDGFLYLLTSNRDGRGDVSDGDDRLVRVDPRVLDGRGAR